MKAQVIFVSFHLFNGTKKEKVRLLKDEKKHQGTMDEYSLKQQFHKSDAIALLCEKSEAILLLLVGLMAGRTIVR